MDKKQYYQLSPDSIYSDVKISDTKRVAKVCGVDILVFPNVFPSDKFRSTALCLNSIKDLVNGKTICDMGCGPGTVGIFSLRNGAKSVVHVDINPFAVQNAIENKALYNFSDNQSKVYKSDCFDNVPKQLFDLIIFPMPYHNDEIDIEDPLQRAFYDPGFKSIKKFLSQIPDYSHDKTEIYISFSNKGDVNQLEDIFNNFGYKWDLWKISNEDSEFDNRFYKINL